MPKKDFKDNPALAYLNTQEVKVDPPQDPVQENQPDDNTSRKKQVYWRVCFNLRPEYKEYVGDEAWKARKTVTEYINDLIAADMVIKQAEGGK